MTAVCHGPIRRRPSLARLLGLRVGLDIASGLVKGAVDLGRTTLAAAPKT